MLLNEYELELKKNRNKKILCLEKQIEEMIIQNRKEEQLKFISTTIDYDRKNQQKQLLNHIHNDNDTDLVINHNDITLYNDTDIIHINMIMKNKTMIIRSMN